MVQVTCSGGAGKAEAAKLPGAGIGPKPCPGKCAAEKGAPTERSENRSTGWASRPIFTAFSRGSFFCRTFSGARLRANSCTRQLRGFCFPGSSRTCDLNHRLAISEGSIGRSSACKSCKCELNQKKLFGGLKHRLARSTELENVPPRAGTVRVGDEVSLGGQ